MFGKPSPNGSGNGWYKELFFRSILELSAMIYFEKNNIQFKLAETKEYSVKYFDYKGNERTYFPDFYLPETDEIIEVKPINLINSNENKLKFDAAKLKYGNKFKILTENEINKLTFDEILIIFNNNQLKWIDRYNNKFKEKYLK